MIPAANLSKDKKRLLALYAGLSEGGRESLFAFAEFLRQREDKRPQPPAAPAIEPTEIPRPAGESVVAAIKRLSRSYHMLDRSKILTETSSLMTAHLMHGRGAESVIDELETLFADAHRQQFGERANGGSGR